ncbi:hypothetical protein [Sphingomonas sp. OTU376]|uniref:hypothetical protein n=1 Tax=Sphingomonas sp. OTU376 TaxID=3043863 RepID=UPI00313DF606
MTKIGVGVLGREQLASQLRVKPPYDETIEQIAAEAPSELGAIAHYALFWGVSDDGYGSGLIGRSSRELRRNLISVVKQYEDQLENWLAGPAAEGPDYTIAYIAYSALMMASDEAGSFEVDDR